jgi:hypothetical protein
MPHSSTHSDASQEKADAATARELRRALRSRGPAKRISVVRVLARESSRPSGKSYRGLRKEARGLGVRLLCDRVPSGVRVFNGLGQDSELLPRGRPRAGVAFFDMNLAALSVASLSALFTAVAATTAWQAARVGLGPGPLIAFQLNDGDLRRPSRSHSRPFDRATGVALGRRHRFTRRRGFVPFRLPRRVADRPKNLTLQTLYDLAVDVD